MASENIYDFEPVGNAMFNCPVCKLTIKDAVEVECPESHVFCKECLDRWKR